MALTIRVPFLEKPDDLPRQDQWDAAKAAVAALQDPEVKFEVSLGFGMVFWEPHPTRIHVEPLFGGNEFRVKATLVSPGMGADSAETTHIRSANTRLHVLIASIGSGKNEGNLPTLPQAVALLREHTAG